MIKRFGGYNWFKNNCHNFATRLLNTVNTNPTEIHQALVIRQLARKKRAGSNSGNSGDDLLLLTPGTDEIFTEACQLHKKKSGRFSYEQFVNELKDYHNSNSNAHAIPVAPVAQVIPTTGNDRQIPSAPVAQVI